MEHDNLTFEGLRVSVRRLAVSSERAQHDTTDDQQCAEACPWTRALAQHQGDPQWVEDRLQHSDQRCLQRRGVRDGTGVKHESQPDLKDPQQQDEPYVPGCERLAKEAWKTDDGREPIAQQDHLGSRVRATVTAAQAARHNREDRDGEAAEQREQVACQPVGTQAIAEEESQTQKQDHHSDPIDAPGMFAEEPDPKRDDVEGGGVL